MSDEVNRAVFEAIARQKLIPADSISLDSSLESLNVSSLDAITIVYEIEEVFDIEVPNDQLDSLETVRDITDGISRLIAEAS
jgi:acyl carrier protein